VKQRTWFSRGGAWALVAAVVVAIEAYALKSGERTLSAQMWAAATREPWNWVLPIVFVAGAAILFAHFYLGLWK